MTHIVHSNTTAQKNVYVVGTVLVLLSTCIVGITWTDAFAVAVSSTPAFSVIATSTTKTIRSVKRNDDDNNNDTARKSSMSVDSKILLVGVTGSTGMRAIQGLLDVGYCPSDLIVLTRNATGLKAQQLVQKGFDVVGADLEDMDGLATALTPYYSSLAGCYIHSTSSDTVELDTGEVHRAENLCNVLRKIPTTEKVSHRTLTVVYNSAASGPNHGGVGRIKQKHEVEEVFETAIRGSLGMTQTQQTSPKETSRSDPPFTFVSLRANIFMEELWKKYTRPSILNGTYPLPVHRFKTVYLTSVRDMGRLAGLYIQRRNRNTVSIKKTNPANGVAVGAACKSYVEIRNVAGDCLRGPQIARAYTTTQSNTVRYVNNRKFTRALSKATDPAQIELYEQVRYLQTNRERTNIKLLQKEFGSQWITSFTDFLIETHWDDKDRSFEDLSKVESLIP